METKKFKCKDEVIFKRKALFFGEDETYFTWDYGIVSFEKESIVRLVGDTWINYQTYTILPYEGNEHLVGTTDEPDEEVRLEEGEWIFVASEIYDWAQKWSLIELNRIEHEQFCTGLVGWCYAVKFSDFNPNDMEETKKHILVVKNGKVVRYKNS